MMIEIKTLTCTANSFRTIVYPSTCKKIKKGKKGTQPHNLIPDTKINLKGIIDQIVTGNTVKLPEEIWEIIFASVLSRMTS